MVASKNPKPRRGIPALLKEVRGRYNALGLNNYNTAASEIGISNFAVAQIIKGKTKNVTHKTEAKLRDWLETTRDDVPDVFKKKREHVPSDDERTVSEMLRDSIVDEMVALLPVLPANKLDHLRTRVAGHIDAALSQQAEAADQLISKLESALANKDEFIRQMQENGKSNADGMTTANLQTMLRLSGEENTNLRAALKSITAVL